MSHCHPQHKKQNESSSVNISGKIAVIIGAIVLIAAGGVGLLWISANQSTNAEDNNSGGIPKTVIEPTDIDFGTIPMSGGVVERTFTVRNEGNGILRVSRLVTSCMCTTAQLEVGTEKSPKFGMAGHGLSSRAWSMDIPEGTGGILHVFFDPNAHGPSGVGPISRTISFETNDPENENIEVAFKGLVVR
ncbi:MAG: hypothetical protein A3A80_03355 [Candidatus Terrybacteria bacterium RIFCSPLOWO2_01_FULL_44_24]|nr:MAG: hypothetical protein A3B75_01845 [Candidatus Terrybacteria bacterium RIFCSPHIGHO2_02_FULL_43_14]OHA51546.1 MAG: hypothetical protein A3A80_03355 [Candidatus Terrybacteria bacterium RIFCSPLOWO2_01_FULL_44_24]